MDLKKRIEENRLYAFSCYVRDWKKQDPSTIARDGDTFSYRTKRGLVKRFRIVKTLSNTSVKVQGFIFDEIKQLREPNNIWIAKPMRQSSLYENQQAIDKINDEWRFEREYIEIIGTVHYDVSDWNFIRFDVGGVQWHMHDGELYQYG